LELAFGGKIIKTNLNIFEAAISYKFEEVFNSFEKINLMQTVIIIEFELNKGVSNFRF
jgi:hypothetical protein